MRTRSQAAGSPPAPAAESLQEPGMLAAERALLGTAPDPRVVAAAGQSMLGDLEVADTESVEVTWGERLFQPVQYNSFRVGPFRASTKLRPGETIAQAMLRLHREIDAAARQVVADAARDYVEELKMVGAMAARERA